MSGTGLGRLTVKNGTSSHALVKLVPVKGNVCVVSMFIRAGDDGQIEHISDGSYTLLFQLGRWWDDTTYKFSESHGTSAFAEPLDFRAYRVDRGMRYDDMSVTLNAVRGGTAHTETFSDADFENY